MQVNPYINFPGVCAEAFKYYAQHLGGTVDMMMTFDSAPPGMPTPENWKTKIMHGSMTIGSTILMGMDASPPMYNKPQGMYVSLQVNTAEEADKAWAALSDGGEIRMPMAETFFAKRFGMVTDRFGIPWMINCAP